VDVSHLLDELNAEQRDAVSTTPGHRLVLAGAGSGKTRVLVHRIAWLIQVEGVSPYGLLAVTFTNKAAAEMRARAEALLNMPTRGLWVGTFHGLAHRMLRKHYREARLAQGFQILDSEDQLRVLKRVIRGLELDESRWPAKQSAWYINARKDEGCRPQHLLDNSDPVTRQLIRIYTAYQNACERAGAVDFAELLLRSLELVRDDEDLQQHYRRRFRHLLVDEFQDTNTLQYAWLRLLAGDTGLVFAVGDDDQSIYGWRGARVENMLNFARDFPGCEEVRLERNYRSTATILKAANDLIERNAGRLGKRLWTDGADGEPIALYTAYNESDEARFVVDRIQHWVEQGGRRDECAVLYRSNAQSRVFEEHLVAAGVPYRVYGGLRFFERAEIKDALAYLRVINNRHDDASLERIINQPPRGIGERTVSLLRDAAKLHDTSLWDAACSRDNGLPPRAMSAVQRFVGLIEEMADSVTQLNLPEQVENAVQASGLMEHYRADRSERGQARVENLGELVTAARTIAFSAEDAEAMSPLDNFLAQAALEAGEAQGGAGDDCVQLMTMHSAKGLEFPTVFLAGMEEGLFPHQMSIEDPARLEEERRLCYVGITRARRHLTITLAEHRRLHGRETFAEPSRFVRELPGELVEEIRPRLQVSRPVMSAPADPPPLGLSVGQRVQHATFGEGVVLDYEGQGNHARVQVNFRDAGAKWLVLAYANLQTL